MPRFKTPSRHQEFFVVPLLLESLEVGKELKTDAKLLEPESMSHHQAIFGGTFAEFECSIG